MRAWYSSALAAAPALALVLALAGGPVRADEMELKGAGFLPSNLQLSHTFQTYMEQANKANLGVKMKYLGGPEVVPANKQPEALKRGVLDIVHAAMSRFFGTVPEADALLGTNKSIDELRKDGGIAALDGYFREKADAHLLAVVNMGLHFNIYLKDKPAFTKDGIPDLKGVKMRTSQTYRELLTQLGATTVSVPSSEVYTALQRGVAQGLAWPAVDIFSTGLVKVVKYRVEPGFFSAPNIIVISLNSWNKLPKETQDKIDAFSRDYEHYSQKHTHEMIENEAAKLKEAGLNFVQAANPKKFESVAFETVWARLASRDKAAAAKLKPLFYSE